MNNFLKKSIVLFLSICIAFESISCAGGMYMGYDMLFDRNYLFDRGSKTTAYNVWFYNKALFEEMNPRTENLKSWAGYLENKYPANDLESFIYRPATDSFNKTKELKRLRAKRISDANVSQKESLFLDFIEFALKVEAVIEASTPDPWAEEQQSINYEDFEQFIKSAQEQIQQMPDAFMKERYAFQLIKLYRYSNQFKEVETTYKTHFSGSTSMLSYWAMEHYAGALLQLDKPIQANYYFVKVYVNCPSKQSSSYLSLKLHSEKDFNKTVALCTTSEEKMALHYIRAMQTKALGLEDMKVITKTLGNHEYARVIMAHEINKFEKIRFNKYEEYEEVKPNALVKKQQNDYLKELITFNEGMLGKDQDDYFWHLSLAYLYYLDHQHAKCSAMLEKVKPASPAIQKQYDIIFIINYLETKETLTEIDENIIGNKLYELNSNVAGYGMLYQDEEDNSYTTDDVTLSDYNTINEFIFGKIYERYKNKNEFLELIFSGSTIVTSLYDEYKPSPEDTPEQRKVDVAYVNQLLSDLDKTSETKLSLFAANYFFRQLEYYYPYSRQEDFESCEKQLKEFKATLLMRDPEHLQEAVDLFNEVGTNTSYSTFYGDPFAFSIKNPDFHDHAENYYRMPSMTKAQFAEKLLELNTNKSTAMDYYKLGLAYYNASYYGLQWDAMAYYRSTYEPNGNFSMKVPELYFKKALAFGGLSDEKKAEIHFMLARCEQHSYTQVNGEITSYFMSNNDYSFDVYMRNMRSAGAFSNFEVISKNYKKTAFYKDLIRECYYFSYYLN